MSSHLIKIMFVLLVIHPVIFSQDDLQAIPPEFENKIPPNTRTIIHNNKLNAKPDQNSRVNSSELYRFQVDLLHKSRQAKEERQFNIVSSFRQNIKFGGFWDRYAVINFTPDMYIEPFSFINIYAVNYTSYFIPIKAATEHFKLMAIQGAVILAIDNIIKHLLPFGKQVKAITGFLLKNTVINSLMKKMVNEGSDKIFTQGYTFCSVKIRF